MISQLYAPTLWALAEQPDFRTKLVEEHINDLRRRHKDTQDWWRALDMKAQGNVAACGFLLAGAFAFAGTGLKDLSPLTKVFLLLAMIAILASLSLSIFALLLKETKLPPDPQGLNRLAQDTLADIDRSRAEAADLYRGFLIQQFDPWVASLRDDSRAAVQKAYRAGLSQYLLLVGVALMSLVVALKVVDAGNESEAGTVSGARYRLDDLALLLHELRGPKGEPEPQGAAGMVGPPGPTGLPELPGQPRSCGTCEKNCCCASTSEHQP